MAITPPIAAIMEPIDDTSVPMITSAGPIRAMTAPIWAINCCCSGVRLLNLSSRLCTMSTTFCMVGASASPTDVARTSKELFSRSIDPPKPLIMASAISSVVPFAPFMASCSVFVDPPTASMMSPIVTPAFAHSCSPSTKRLASPFDVLSISSTASPEMPSFSSFALISS